MTNRKKRLINLSILIPIIILAVVSYFTIESAESLFLRNNNYAGRQLLWYVIGFGVIIGVMIFKNKSIMKLSWPIYGVCILLLILLLLFGPVINDTQRWFVIPYVGSFQPSEFMKISLILTLATMITNFREKINNPSVLEEFIFLLKVGAVVFVPSFLTLLQPDTGVIMIYIIITFIMLFISGIRYRWFLVGLGVVAGAIIFMLTIYFTNTDLFISIFGTDFFLRVDRLLDWQGGVGFQLENSMVAIGSGGFTGAGHNATPIFFPEPHTDFIFAVFASNYGFLGSILLIGLLLYLNIRIIILGMKSSNPVNKYLISGFVAMLMYQQLQNIGMTFGLMPITGITLPFISYGGSSLISYMIVVGIILNISNEEQREKMI